MGEMCDKKRVCDCVLYVYVVYSYVRTYRVYTYTVYVLRWFCELSDSVILCVCECESTVKHENVQSTIATLVRSDVQRAKNKI